jgi:phosphoribosylformimino-5-aminoimidazole carboxamide ribotide isomerase
MIVYPAMDLLGGKPVRLAQGRFEDRTDYGLGRHSALRAFADAGASWAHVVDLDGARAKEPRQHDFIASLARSSGLELQVGGGFRTRDHVAQALDAGIARVVLGSVAVKYPALVNGWIDAFGPDRLCLSLDVRIADGVPIVATGGWLEDSGASLWEVAERFPRARHLLITDIGRDGMLSGPNLPLYREAVERLPNLEIQASGGVSSLQDLKSLPTAGAVLGKALWEGRIRLEEALSCAGA